MTTTTIYASTTNSALVTSRNATYTTARAGSNKAVNLPNSVLSFNPCNSFVSPNYFCQEVLFDFDTSSIPDTATINSVTLQVYTIASRSVTFTVECRIYDFGSSITTADYVPGANIGTYTLVATLASSSLVNGSYVSFTENGTNFRDNINKTGSTRLLISLDKTRLGTVPTDANYQANFDDPDDATTTKRPILVIDYTNTYTQSNAGTTGTLSGSLIKKTKKAFTGASGSLSGTFSGSRVLLKSLSGTAGAVSGALTRQAGKLATGSITSASGTVSKAISKTVSGTAGALTGLLTYFKTNSYTISLSGVVGDLLGSTDIDRGSWRNRRLKAGSAIVSVIMRGGNTKRWQ